MNGEEKRTASEINIKNRETVVLSGIEDVVSFDESAIYLITSEGKLVVEGSGLHITALDVALGKMTVDGYVTALTYDDREKGRKQGLFSRK